VADEDLEPAETLGKEELSSKELAARRLYRVDKLLSLYKDEYWHLMEELRHRHAEYAAAHGQAGYKAKRAPGNPARPVEEAWGERAGRGAGAEVPTFSDCEEEVLGMETAGAPGEDELRARAEAWDARAALLARLEEGAGASSSRDMDRAGALAALVGRRARFYVRQPAVTVGRKGGDTDVDLGLEGDAGRVSREQAFVALGPDGVFRVRNVGRQEMHVNGQALPRGHEAALPHLGLVEVGGLSLLFLVNRGAVQRALLRSRPRPEDPAL